MTQTHIKQNIHKHRTQNLQRTSPLGITPAEKAHKARTRWYCGPFRRFINTKLKKSINKEWTEAIKNSKILYKCITANTSVIWQHAAHTTDQLSSPNCWTGAIQKSLSLNEKYWRIFWKKFRRKDLQTENDKTHRVTGLGRRTREEIAKWNQMTALRLQTWGETSDIPGLPSGAWTTGFFTCAQMLKHATAQGGVQTPEEESALKVDSGRKIPCCTGESNLCQWRGSPMLYHWHTSPPFDSYSKLF